MSLVFVAVLALSPQGNPEVAVWKPSAVKAASLFREVEKRMGKLTMAEVVVTTEAMMPKRGGKGSQTSTSRLKNARTFRIEYPHFSFQRKQELSIGLLRADGRRWVYQVGDLPIRKGPIATVPMGRGATVLDWVTKGNLLALAPLTGEKSFSALVGRIAAEGGRIRVEERILRRLNRPIRQYRVRLDRSAANAKRLGGFEFGITIDSVQKLPVTLEQVASPAGRDPLVSVSRFAWKRRTTAWPAAEFKIEG